MSKIKNPLFFWTFTLGLISSLWVINDLDRKAAITAYIGLAAAMTFFYALLIKRKKKIELKWVIIFTISSTVFTPVTLESDIFRYIWDGLSAKEGVNPYAYSPEESPLKAKHKWHQEINHTEYHTIYPPFAQLNFQISSYLNPFHSQDFAKKSRLSTFEYWKLTFGWKIWIAILTCFCVVLISKKRIDLFIFHPLVTLKGLVNGHLDFLVALTFLLIFHSAWIFRNKLRELFTLTLSILLKWFPIIFLPLIIFRRGIKPQGSERIYAFIFCATMTALSILTYKQGSQGHFFDSFLVYSENWYFFGYLHRWISDGLTLLAIPNHTAIQYGKLASAFFGFIVFLLLFYAGIVKRRLSLTLACTLLFMAYLSLNPTLHPWYLLPLLAIGLRHLEVLSSLWIWPALSLLSISFYYENHDPLWIRNFVYIAVTYFAWKDLRKVFC